LPDHFHLLVETPEANLVLGMKWMLGTYTVRFNKRHRQSGHLFQGRYHSGHVSPSGGFLAQAADYIHLNPDRVRRIEPREPLQSYRWSSLGFYLDSRSRPPWLKVAAVLKDCGQLADNPDGRAKYERHVEDARGQSSNEMFERLRRDWCFGGEAYRKRVLGELESCELLLPAQGRFRGGALGPAEREAAEFKANKLIQDELKAIGATAAALPSWRKGDPRKVQIAQRLRAETTMTFGWIAERLQMGARSHLIHLLYWKNRTKAKRSEGGKPAMRAPKANADEPTILTSDTYSSVSLEQLDPRFD
jgi:hypothetical protein